jgi:hypothetical protein
MDHHKRWTSFSTSCHASVFPTKITAAQGGWLSDGAARQECVTSLVAIRGHRAGTSDIEQGLPSSQHGTRQ